MKKTRQILYGAMALTVAASFAACGGGDDSGSGENTTTTTESVTTTTAVTVEINTDVLQDEEQSELEQVMAKLPDVELANKEVKFLSHYNINPTTRGESKKVEVEMFEQKYGGTLKWYETTYTERWNKLSTLVLGGEGIDFYVSDNENLPGRIVSGMFQSVDDYIDLNDAIWQNTAEAMEIYRFGDRHYMFVTNARTQYYIFYSYNTLEQNGLDDPWELYQNGEWNWDTFKSMLTEFVDEENDQYGLDCWYIAQSLLYSAGVPSVGTDDTGNLVCNLNDPTIEKAMNFQAELYKDGLIFPFETTNGQIQPAYMGEGKELFWIDGYWQTDGKPETWTTQIAPDDLGIAPIPNPADSDREYQPTVLEGYVLCKGATNPEGVARFAECTILGAQEPSMIEIIDRKLKDDSQLSDDLIERKHIIDDLAKKNPVVDLAPGVSVDVNDYLWASGESAMKAAYYLGTDWATTRETYYDAINGLVIELNDQLQTTVSKESAQ